MFNGPYNQCTTGIQPHTKKIISQPLVMETKNKRPMTDKQKAARLANLERGRKKRMESIKQKKEDEQEPKGVEYDLSSEDDRPDLSSSDSDAFVISKKKPKKKQKTEKGPLVPLGDNLRDDFDELKSMVTELAKMQKKQHKSIQRNSAPKKEGGTKIVVLPQNNAPQANRMHDSVMEATEVTSRLNCRVII